MTAAIADSRVSRGTGFTMSPFQDNHILSHLQDIAADSMLCLMREFENMGALDPSADLAISFSSRSMMCLHSVALSHVLGGGLTPVHHKQSWALDRINVY